MEAITLASHRTAVRFSIGRQFRAVRRASVALLAVVAVTGAETARAETVTVQFTSTVTYVQNQPVLGITTTLGAAVSGQFNYDRTAVDTDPGDPSRGIYTGGTVQVNLDGHPVVGSSSLLVVFDFSGGNDLFTLADGTSQSGNPILVDGVSHSNGFVSLNFTRNDGTVLTSDALPTAAQIPLLEISQFNLVQEGTNGVLLFDNVTITGVHSDALKITSIGDVGNDQGRQARTKFNRAAADAPGSLTPIVQYEAFRRLDVGLTPAFAASTDQPARDARQLGMMSNASILGEGWEFVRAIPAHGQASYSMIVPTLADSTLEGGIHWSAFFIRAATNDPFTFWDSEPDSGYSVDNLAPNVPAGFMVTQQLPNNDLVLSWVASADADFRYYALHRGSSAGFVPTEANRVASLTANSYVDVGAGATLPVYYKLSATDFAGNPSGFASASSVGVADVGGDTPIALALRPITPNPARATSVARFELPRPGRVRLAIHDVHGRIVRVLVDGFLPAGTHRADWDGRGERGTPVPAGIYVYNLSSDGQQRLRKVAVLD